MVNQIPQSTPLGLISIIGVSFARLNYGKIYKIKRKSYLFIRNYIKKNL